MIKNINTEGLQTGQGKLESLKRNISAKNFPGKQKDEKLMKACEGFESVFLQKVLESMRDTLPGDALFEKSHGMQIYKSMHDQYLAEDLSKSHKFGISDMLYRQLSKKS